MTVNLHKTCEIFNERLATMEIHPTSGGILVRGITTDGIAFQSVFKSEEVTPHFERLIKEIKYSRNKDKTVE